MKQKLNKLKIYFGRTNCKSKVETLKVLFGLKYKAILKLDTHYGWFKMYCELTIISPQTMGNL